MKKKITKQNFKEYLKPFNMSQDCFNHSNKTYFELITFFNFLNSRIIENLYYIGKFKKGLVVVVKNESGAYFFIYIRLIFIPNKPGSTLISFVYSEIDAIEKIYLYEKMYDITLFYNKDFFTIIASSYFNFTNIYTLCNFHASYNEFYKMVYGDSTNGIKKEMDIVKNDLFLNLFLKDVSIKFRKPSMLYVGLNNKPKDHLTIYEKFLKLFLYENDELKFDKYCFKNTDFFHVFKFLKVLKFKNASFYKIKRFYNNNTSLFYKKPKLFLLFLECLIIFFEKQDSFYLDKYNSRIESFLNILLKNLLSNNSKFLKNDFIRVLSRVVLFFGYFLNKKVKILKKLLKSEKETSISNTDSHLIKHLIILDNLFSADDVLSAGFFEESIYNLDSSYNYYNNEFHISNLISNIILKFRLAYIFRRKNYKKFKELFYEKLYNENLLRHNLIEKIIFCKDFYFDDYFSVKETSKKKRKALIKSLNNFFNCQ